jgi:lipoyl(octanoyl) transferase
MAHPSKMPIAAHLPPVEWAISSGYVDYDHALQVMALRATEIREGNAKELVWLL